MINLNKIGHRLKEYLNFKKISANELGRISNLSSSQVSYILSGNNYGVEKLINILNNNKDLNPVWLITGEGEMIVGPDEETDKNDQLAKKNQELETKVETLTELLREFKK